MWCNMLLLVLCKYENLNLQPPNELRLMSSQLATLSKHVSWQCFIWPTLQLCLDRVHLSHNALHCLVNFLQILNASAFHYIWIEIRCISTFFRNETLKFEWTRGRNYSQSADIHVQFMFLTARNLCFPEQLVSLCYTLGFPGMKPQFITLLLWEIRACPITAHFPAIVLHKSDHKRGVTNSCNINCM